jgi:hypothetical protein
MVRQASERNAARQIREVVPAFPAASADAQLVPFSP